MGSKEVKTFNAFTSHVVKPTDFYILGLFEDKTDALFEIFSHFSSKYSEDFKIFHSFNKDEFLKHFKSVKIPVILVFYHDLSVTKNEPRYKVFEQQSNVSLEDLEIFVFRESLPLVGHLSPQNKPLVFDKIRPLCYVFHDIDFELKSRKLYSTKVSPFTQIFNPFNFKSQT